MSILGLKKQHMQRRKSFNNSDAGYHLDDMNQEDISIQNQDST